MKKLLLSAICAVSMMSAQAQFIDYLPKVSTQGIKSFVMTNKRGILISAAVVALLYACYKYSKTPSFDLEDNAQAPAPQKKNNHRESSAYYRSSKP